jgi:tetratricopeptide (TPR) repeat protein
LQPDYFGAHFNLALTLEERGKLPEAEAEYRLLLRRSPGLTRAYYQLGFNLFRQNRREEAAEALEAFLDHGGEGRAEVEAIIRRLREP